MVSRAAWRIGWADYPRKDQRATADPTDIEARILTPAKPTTWNSLSSEKKINESMRK